jgi:hypothetical protein
MRRTSVRASRHTGDPSARLAASPVVEGLGVAIYRHAGPIEQGRVRTPFGDVRADVVVRAARRSAATCPACGARSRRSTPHDRHRALPDAFWADAGLAQPDLHRLRLEIICRQRTADGRFAFGGRGARTSVRGSGRIRRDRNVFRSLRDLAFAVP